jgi:hypothetical protein
LITIAKVYFEVYVFVRIGRKCRELQFLGRKNFTV